MKKKQPKDNVLAYTAAIAVASAVIIFVIGWAYFNPLSQAPEQNAAFVQVEPVRVQNLGYTFVAELAIQTSKDDARWARKHQKELNTALQQALMNIDPKLLRTPTGLQSMQASLAATLNRSLDQPRIQRVLFTDFISQADFDEEE